MVVKQAIIATKTLNDRKLIIYFKIKAIKEFSKEEEIMDKTKESAKDAPLLIQMLIYAAILFVSQFISDSMPKSFPLPTPVIGLVLLYLLLTFKIIKVEWVDSFGAAMIGLIGFLFVPSGISLAGNLKIMREEGVQLVIVILIATIILLVVTAYTTRILNWVKNKITHQDMTVSDDNSVSKGGK